MSSSLPQVFVEHGNLHGTTSFIKSMGVACYDSVNYNWVQVLSIPVLLLTCSQDVVRGQNEKSGMADHIWKEKGNHLPL